MSKLTEMFNLILFFSEIPKIVICVRVKQGALRGLKMLSVWSSALFTVFRFRNAWKESI